MADVFVSYARKDKFRASEFADMLCAAGLNVWWDPNIYGGAKFADIIEAELERASIVIVLWSKTSIHSRWVADEAGYAVEHEKLIPVLLENIEPPIGFRQFQTIDFSDIQDTSSRTRLYKAINEISPDIDINADSESPVAIHAPFLIVMQRHFARFVRRRPRQFLFGGILLVVAAAFIAASQIRENILRTRLADMTAPVLASVTSPDPWQVLALNDAVFPLTERREPDKPLIQALTNGEIAAAEKVLVNRLDGLGDNNASKEEQVEALKQLAALIHYSDPQRARDELLKASSLAPRDPVIMNQLGNLFFQLGEPDAAYAYFAGVEDAALEAARKGDANLTSKELVRLSIASQIGIGRTYLYNSQYDLAAESLDNARAAAARIKARHEEALALEKRGIVAEARGNLNDAYAFLARANILARSIGNKAIEGSSIASMGDNILDKALAGDRDVDLALAKSHLEAALRINRETNHHLPAAAVYFDLGILSNLQSNADEAERYFSAGKALADQNGFWRMRTLFRIELGALLIADGDATAACAHFYDARKIYDITPKKNENDLHRIEDLQGKFCNA